MLTIPTGIQLNAAEQKVGIGNFLAGVFVAISILLNHHRPALPHLQFHEHKPVYSANFIQMAASSVHEPISTRRIGQVFGAIGEQVFAGDAIVACGACKLTQLLGNKNGGRVHVLRSCVWQHTVCFLSSGLGNRHCTETRWMAFPQNPRHFSLRSLTLALELMGAELIEMLVASDSIVDNLDVIEDF